MTEMILLFLDGHLSSLSGSVHTEKHTFYNLIWAILSNTTGGSIDTFITMIIKIC